MNDEQWKQKRLRHLEVGETRPTAADERLQGLLQFDDMTCGPRPATKAAVLAANDGPADSTSPEPGDAIGR